MDVRTKLAPPWITFVNEMDKLFNDDPDISVVYDNDDLDVSLFVETPEKAEALSRLLPMTKTFGNIVLSITIIPANGFMETDEPDHWNKKELFDIAFKRNPVYAFSYLVDTIFDNSITYVVFKNKVVQFFNDNLNDVYGNISTLYQNIAADVFAEKELQGVYFCTDIEEKVGMPLGEWP